MRGLSKRFWIMVALAAGTVVMGTIGLLAPLAAGGRAVGIGSVFDAALEAVAYLTLNGFGPVEDGSALAIWSTRVARLLALAFVVAGVGAVVTALLDEFGTRRFRWRATGVFAPAELELVCGLDGPGLSFIDNACKADAAANRRTVAIDAAPSPRAVAASHRRKVPLLIDDPAGRGVLERIRLDRLARVFVSTGSDEANLRVVFQLATLLREKQKNETRGKRENNNGPLSCMVHLKDAAACAPLLKALPQDHGLDLRVFNVCSVTAREFYRESPLDRFGPDFESLPGARTTTPAGVHLALLGEGEMADELLLQALQLGILEPVLSLRVDVLVANPQGAAERWRERYPCYSVCPGITGDSASGHTVRLCPDKPWITERVLPAIDFHRMPTTTGGRADWCSEHCGEPGWATTVIVATPDPTASALWALDLREPLRLKRKEADVELRVYLGGAGTDRYEDLFKDVDVTWIRPFRDYLGDCRRDLAVASCIEEAARRVNQVYWLGGQGDEPGFLLDRDSRLKLWRECSEADRDSSRQAAAHAWVKQRILARLHLYDGPAGAAGSAADYVAGDGTRLLATVEHRRWCAQQLLAGVKPLLSHVPLTEEVGQWSGEDRRNSLEWFNPSGTAKASWKLRHRHIDLMPFASLKRLNDVALGSKLGDSEQAKDLSLARLTDFIVNGRG